MPRYPDKIYYKVYVSSASKLLTDKKLFSLLKKTRINNSRRQITGLLLYYEGSFIEILEGDQKIVDWLFHERIVWDPRHTNVTELISGYEDFRSFPDYSMGFKRLDPSELGQEIPSFNSMIECRDDLEDQYRDINKKLLIFLRSFYKASGISYNQ